MPETAKSSTLHKMTAPKSGAGLPVARQLRRALETGADKRLGLPLEVRSVHQSLRPLEEVRGLLEGSGFLALLEGRPGAGFGLDMTVLTGLVEHQTIGHILPRSDMTRGPTRVDAALLAPLLDDSLGRFDNALREDGGGPWGLGYGFGAMVGTARALVLALSEGLYHVFELDLALMGGVREGRMVFAFPDKVEATPPKEAPAPDPVPPGESLRAGVLTAQATLDAVLARVSMPLARFQGLSVGDTIPLPPGALKDARLEMGAKAGGVPVTLGQLHGFRAVRLKAGQIPAPGEAGNRAEATAPLMREALEETPDVADMPLETVELAQELSGEEDTETAADIAMQDGLDDLDDLLGDAEDAMSLHA
jgi:flagellar motor switch protein FliM